MGMVVKRIRLRGDKGASSVLALFDTGASKSLVRRNVAIKIATLLKAPRPWTFQLGDGRGRLRADEMAGLFFQLQRVPIAHTFIVARYLADDVVIGTDLMQFWKIRPDPAREDVIIDKRLIKLKLV